MFNRIISKIKEFFGIYEIDYIPYNNMEYEDEFPEIITSDIESYLNENDNNDYLYYNKKKISGDKNKQRKKYQFEMMELMLQKERIVDKIKSFVPIKDKDYKKLNKWYADIKNIDAELKFLEMESEIYIDDVFNGSKFERYKIKQQRRFKKIKRKVKRFYKENKHAICEIGFIASICVIKFVICKLLPL